MINEHFNGAFVFNYKEHEGKGEKDTFTINFNDELKWIFATKNIKDLGGFRDFLAEGDYRFEIDDDLEELKGKGLFNDEYLKDFGLNVEEFERLAQRLKESSENSVSLLYEMIGYESNINNFYYGIGDIDFFIDMADGHPLDLDFGNHFSDDILSEIFEEAMQKQGSMAKSSLVLTTEGFDRINAFLPTIFVDKIYDWTKDLIEDGKVSFVGDNEYKTEYAKLLIFDYAERHNLEFELDLNGDSINKEAEITFEADSFFEKQILEFYSKDDELQRRIYTNTFQYHTAKEKAEAIMKNDKNISYCLIKLKGSEDIKMTLSGYYKRQGDIQAAINSFEQELDIRTSYDQEADKLFIFVSNGAEDGTWIEVAESEIQYRAEDWYKQEAEEYLEFLNENNLEASPEAEKRFKEWQEFTRNKQEQRHQGDNEIRRNR